MPITEATQPSARSRSLIEADRRVATPLVYISDTNLFNTRHSELIRRVRVEHNAEGASYGEVEFRNIGPDLTSDDLFREGRYVELHMGYATGSIDYQMRFINRTPKVSFTDPKTFTISGFSEIVRFMRFKRRRIFKGVKYSEIARLIATSDYGYGDDALSIDETDSVLPSVSQVNESDYEFLQRIARRCGREVRITNEFFEFKTPGDDVCESPIDIADKEVQLVDVRIRGEGKALAVSATTTDPLTGQILWGQSQKVSDPIGDVEDGKGFRSLNRVAAIRTKFIDTFSSFPTQGEIDRIVDDMANRSKYIVTAHAKMVGRSWMRANQWVVFLGLGRFEGPFLTKKVVQEIKGGTFTTEVVAVRAWTYPTIDPVAIGNALTTGGNSDLGRQDVTAESQEVGKVDF